MSDTVTDTPAADPTEQLDALLGDDGKSFTVTTLDGETRTFPVETFSSFKTAATLKLLASAKDRINVGDLLKQLSLLANPLPQDKILHCPHCKTVYDPKRDSLLPEDKAGEGQVIGCNVQDCGLTYHLKDALVEEVDVTNDRNARTQAILTTLPELLSVAPDLLNEFAALATIPNKELKRAYETPGGIEKLRTERKEFFEFECDSGVPLQCFQVYASKMGISFLLRELMRMGVIQQVMGLMKS